MTTNPIVLENQKPGTPQSTWAIHGSIANQGDSQIEGFATQISANVGQTVNFKIDTGVSGGYTVDIYRLGYYGGDGARLVASMHNSSGTNQPNPTFNSSTNTVDAGNWSVTNSWAVPTDATSGVYFAKLTTDNGNYQNIIPFIVRNDGTPSDVVFQTSDTTWQAYNPWGGYNLYGGPDGKAADRASAVSYNRPILINSAKDSAQPADFLFGEEYAAIYWLEENGYSIKYISGLDAATNPSALLNSKIYMDVGHDEYWTQSQYNNVQAAANAGVNLAFLSGNTAYWDSALAPDVNGVPNRTLVQYKDVWSGAQLDPNGTSGGGAGLFRDPVYGPGAPENALVGTLSTVDESGKLLNVTIPASMSQFRLWRNTSIATGNGGTLANLLGYEWQSDLNNGSRPPGLIDLSSSTYNNQPLFVNNGALPDGTGTATHSLTLYRNPTSGALVFSAGTVMWSWGLDGQYVPYKGSVTAPVSPAVEQAMVNLFADMGVQPQTLLSSLQPAQQSTDHTPPIAAITTPTGGQNYSVGQALTITGTASDVGGIVAGVEVSTDSGQTWHPATGTTNWSYSWAAAGSGNVVIEARAIDDSVNVQPTPATVAVNLPTIAPWTGLFSPSDTPVLSNIKDGKQIEVGVKFTSSVAGSITGIEFYRATGDTGPDIAQLWSSTGSLLASATLSNASTSGWQRVNFSSPVVVTPGTTYVAAYHSTGAYAATNAYFATDHTNGSLTAPSSAASSGNGLYAYGGTSTTGLFPTNTYDATNYFVDVVFSSGANLPPVASADSGFVTPENTPLTIATSSLLANDTDPQGYALSVTSVAPIAGTTQGTVSLSGSTITYTPPSMTFTGADSFAYTISDGHGGTASATVALNVAAPWTGLFSISDTPAKSYNDGKQVEVGVKFTSSVAGSITGIEFYRATGDTGPDIAQLWSSTGTLLASGTFSNTSASGWQTVTFSSPVAITAGTTYVASYHSTGNYVGTNNYFTSAHTNGSLTALSSTASSGNGLYAYGGTSTTGLFPTNTYKATNYFVDVVFSRGANLPPVANADSGFVTPENTPLTIATSSLLANDTDPQGYALSVTSVAPIAGTTQGTVSLSGSTITYTPPSATFTGADSFGYTISDGHGGTASATVALNVTTPAATQSLFSASDTPAKSYNDGKQIEVGVKFTSSVAGSITGIEFYRAAGDTAPDIAQLWSSTGTLLASGTFSNTSASGWQTVTFSSPVAITAGTTYVAAYHSTGNYVGTNNYFTSAHTNGSLTAPSSGNGVYAYGGTSTTGLFPTNTYKATNYFVDVVFNPQLTS